MLASFAHLDSPRRPMVKALSVCGRYPWCDRYWLEFRRLLAPSTNGACGYNHVAQQHLKEETQHVLQETWMLTIIGHGVGNEMGYII